ncbi:hypothetical protein RKD26_000075 [Streptomyces calvus]
MPIVLPLSPATSETPVSLRTTRASFSPATSRIQATLYGIGELPDTPRANGLEPRAAMSRDLPRNAWLTPAPESNLIQVIVWSGRAFSSSFLFFTSKSPLGKAK